MRVIRCERHNPTSYDAWAAYNKAFEPVRRRAMQKHVMSWEEWCDVVEDPYVQKHLALDDNGQLAGMSVITNHLPAWHWIEERYFEAHYPRQWASGAVWYVGFVFTVGAGRGAHAELREVHAFSELIRSMWPQVIASDGIAVMDYSKWAVEVSDLARIAWLVQKRLNPKCRFAHEDSQLYYVYDHKGKED